MQINYPLISYVTAIIGTIIGFVITGLLVFRRDKIKGTGYLILWILTLGCSIQIIGATIIALKDSQMVLLAYQLAVMVGVSCVFIYRFVEQYFQLKPMKLLNWMTYIYLLIVFVMVLFFRDWLVTSVIWDPEVQYYKSVFGPGTLYAGYFGMLLWMIAIVRLVIVYKKSISAVERNRLKYLLMGIIFPLLGVILITFPVEAIRRYPSDMWGTAIGMVFMAYGILKYRLMDISVIISRGLVYTVISSFIAGVYVFILFLISNSFSLQEVNQTYIAALLTAFIVAFIYQPLQSYTQRLIDALLGFDEESKRTLIKDFSSQMTEVINFEMVSKSLLKTVTKGFKAEYAFLMLKQVSSENFKIDTLGNIKILPKEIHCFNQAIKEIEWDEDIVKSLDVSIDQEFIKNFGQLGIVLLVRLSMHSQTIGILGLGTKRSGKPYTLIDYQALEVIANQSSIALENISHFEKERELDKLKSEFINIASHNLRTPLTSIIGYVDLLKGETNDDALKEVENRLNLSSAVHQLASLVEQLITVSSVEGETIALNKSNCDISNELNAICDELQLQAKGKNIFIHRNIDQVNLIPLDLIKMRLVLFSLMENAIKFTERGSVTVDLTLKNQLVTITISDTGIGIPAEEMPHLFEKFYQIHSRFEPMVGVGLGLYLSRVIINAHGGVIRVDSEPGKGSQFIIELPI